MNERGKLYWEAKYNVYKLGLMVTLCINNVIFINCKFNIKLSIWGAAREKQLITYKGNPIRLINRFFNRNFAGQREWYDIFKALKVKEKACLTKNTVPSKIIFRSEREVKSFLVKQKLKKFITTKPDL